MLGDVTLELEPSALDNDLGIEHRGPLAPDRIGHSAQDRLTPALRFMG